ncbi:hypothetical protein DVB73_06850 [Pseudomonas plecoglossicida]|uniref:Uncharacterized protein n=1 Tax=Pseudomonas plecoglossicida TaxID=70775 RepID=A0AAD0QV27_PSEDL|nr:hypothetical protein DVB73_06850 [Pseudomonas plecoglossicida]
MIFDDVRFSAVDIERSKNATSLEQATEMTCWESIKDWFGGGVQRRALTELYTFFHGVSDEKEQAFDFLKGNCEKKYAGNFEEKIDIATQSRRLIINVGEGRVFSQAVPLWEEESAAFLVKHYGDFYAAALDDQQGFVASYKDVAVLKAFSDGLHAALQQAFDRNYNESSGEVHSSPLGQWVGKKFEAVIRDNPEVASYLIENRNHPAVKEWRLQHPSPAAVTLSPEAQSAFTKELLEPVAGDLEPSGISIQAANDWNRTELNIAGQVYNRDPAAAADALHALTGNRELSALISRYANQGALAPVIRAMQGGSLHLRLPDGGDVRHVPSGNSFYSIAKEKDGSIRLDFNYDADCIKHAWLDRGEKEGPEMVLTEGENSRFNARFALRFSADNLVSVAAPLTYESEFALAKEGVSSANEFV